MFGAQYSVDKFPLSPELQAKGVTESQWAGICASLREGKGMTGMGGGFSAAIAKLCRLLGGTVLCASQFLCDPEYREVEEWALGLPTPP